MIYLKSTTSLILRTFAEAMRCIIIALIAAWLLTYRLSAWVLFLKNFPEDHLLQVTTGEVTVYPARELKLKKMCANTICSFFFFLPSIVQK